MNNITINHWVYDVTHLVKLDLIQFFRNKLIVVSTLLTSVSMVLAFGLGTVEMPGHTSQESYFTFILPGIVGVGIMFSSTYTMGYAFIVDCHRRTMEDIVLSPLSYMGFIVGRIIGMLIKCALQFILVIVIAVIFFDTTVTSYFPLAFAFITECLTFASLGIIVATITNEISFSGLINLFIIPLSYFGGVFFPLDSFGELSNLISKLPLSVHIDMFREAINATPSTHINSSKWLAVLYTVLSIGIAMYAFKRRIQRL